MSQAAIAQVMTVSSSAWSAPSLTGGTGADLVLESVGGATLDASLAATKRVTGRIVVYGLAGGEAAITNWRPLLHRRREAARRSGGAASQQRHGGLSSVTGRHPRSP